MPAISRVGFGGVFHRCQRLLQLVFPRKTERLARVALEWNRQRLLSQCKADFARTRLEVRDLFVPGRNQPAGSCVDHGLGYKVRNALGLQKERGHHCAAHLAGMDPVLADDRKARIGFLEISADLAHRGEEIDEPRAMFVGQFTGHL